MSRNGSKAEANRVAINRARTHPLRERILAEMQKRAWSPSELSEELGAPLGNVSYHVRVLFDLRLIRLTKKTPRRGAIEHHYEARADSFALDPDGLAAAVRVMAHPEHSELPARERAEELVRAYLTRRPW